ncbi:MAG: DUF2953 domain-containing protein [Lachnospiraceae bacterium]|nr:DUF2953 domain-containing protein [Lachnospiraceae bacterium]
MQIFLLILKIIGIVLLSILGILLFLVLSLLFIPICYGVTGKKQDSLELDIKVSWFLRIVYFRLHYKENFGYVFRIFGYPIKKEDGYEKEEEIETLSEEKENKEKDTPKNKENNVDKNQEEGTKYVDEKKPEVSAKNSNEDEEGKQQNISQNPEESGEESGEETSFFGKKIRIIKEKLRKLGDKIKSVASKPKEKYDSFIEKKNGVLAFIENKENKQGMKFLWEQIKKLLKHILPVKWKGKLVFGTGDPATTGKLLGIISMLGGMAGIMPDIKPDFEKKIIEGDFSVKGRIYLYYVLYLVIKLWLDERFQTLKANVQCKQ